jgi:hypothetical protein
MKRLLFLLALAPALINAQDLSMASARPLRPLGTTFLRTDSVEVGVRSRSVWRGLQLGAWPFVGGIHMGLWQIDGINDKHAIIGRAVAMIPMFDRERVNREDLTELYAGYRYRIDTEQGEANLGYADRRFAFSPGSTHRRSIEGAVQHRIDAPLTEIRPILGLAAARETGDAPTTWIEGQFVFEAGLPPRNNNAASYGGRFELRGAASNFPVSGESDRSMRFHDAVFALWLSADRSSTVVGPLMMELGGELWWTHVPLNTTYALLVARFVVR